MRAVLSVLSPLRPTELLCLWGIVLFCEGLCAAPLPESLPGDLRKVPPLLGAQAYAFPGDAFLRNRTSANGPLEMIVDQSVPDPQEHTLDVHTIYIQLQRLAPAEYKLRTTFFAKVRTTYGRKIGLDRPLKSVDVTYILLDYDGKPVGDKAYMIQWIPAAGSDGLGPVSRWEVRSLGTIPLKPFWRSLRPWQQDRLKLLTGFLKKHRDDSPVGWSDLPADTARKIYAVLKYPLSESEDPRVKTVLEALDYFKDTEFFNATLNGDKFAVGIGSEFTHRELKDSNSRTVFRTDGNVVWRQIVPQ